MEILLVKTGCRHFIDKLQFMQKVTLKKQEVDCMNIKELRQLTGLSQKAFSDKYKIPKRTIEDWEAERRTPPEYVALLLERVIKYDFDQ